jgi:HJR/Mrr/RecB family endonuclease
LLISKKIHINVKKKLIKKYVWSVATYGCETWVINDTEKKKLEAFEM